MPFIGKTPTPVPLTANDIADGIISNSKLAQDIISAETELATAPADTDEFLISDAGTLKRIDASLVGGGVVQKIETQLNSTRATVSNSSSKVTLFSGTYTNVKASSKVLIMMRIPVHTSRAGALNTGFTWNGTDYNGAIVNSYEDSDNLTLALMIRSFDNPASTGSIAWSVYFQSMSGSSTAPFGVINPNASDDSRMSQTSTQTTFLEYTT